MPHVIEHIKTAVISWIIVSLGFVSYTLIHEPQPYIKTSLTVESPVVVGDPIKMSVMAQRTKHCPYIIEREFINESGIVLEKNRKQLTPTIPREYADNIARYSYEYKLSLTPEPGLVVYRSRIGTMCNFVQEFWFPQWSDWRTHTIEFIESPKDASH